MPEGCRNVHQRAAEEGKLQKGEMRVMQPAYENLYKYRRQLTVITTYKIGILLDIEHAAHITRHHNALLSLQISIFAAPAIKVLNMKRTFVLISVRGKAISNISPGYYRDGLLGELACIWRTPARQINPRRIKEAARWRRRCGKEGPWRWTVAKKERTGRRRKP